MQNRPKLSFLDWAGIIACLILLVGVRLFENRLFYDPFLMFFKGIDKTPPAYNSGRLFLGYVFRYVLNTLFSMGILWLLFKDRGIIKLTSVLYGVLFVILAVPLFIVINTDDPSLSLIFYLRRFLIQPLPLLLFVPAFYYQRYIK